MELDAGLFVAIAEIGGVFVGFGALISVTRKSEVESNQLSQIRAVVTIGLVVIVAALVPVALSEYGLSGHALWFLASLIFLALIWAVIGLSLRTPENRQLMIGEARTNPLSAIFFWLWLEIPIQVPAAAYVVGPVSRSRAGLLHHRSRLQPLRGEGAERQHRRITLDSGHAR